MLYVMVIYMGDDEDSKTFFWTSHFFTGVLPSVYTLIKTNRRFFIHTTSVVGSFLIIRGISLVAGGFPPPFD